MKAANPDGKVAVFHLDDGWIRRAPVDVREICQRGQGVLEPSFDQFVTTLKRFPLEARAALLVWPEGTETPTWIGAAHAEIMELAAAAPAAAPEAPAEAAKPAASDFVDAAPPAKPKK